MSSINESSEPINAAASGAVASTTMADRLLAALQRTLPMARLELQAVPHCNGLRLALINNDFPVGPLPAEVMHAVVADPAYWAFCWGSGQALARYLLNHPELVTGKRVLDLGSGSGVAGIAAAMAGADRVIACDTDKDAQLATLYNAALNKVEIELVDDFVDQESTGTTKPYDAVLMADVLYDKTNLPLLKLAAQVGTTVWVADSRIRQLNEPGFRARTSLEALTLPNLGEFDEFGTTQIWSTAGDSI